MLQQIKNNISQKAKKLRFFFENVVELSRTYPIFRAKCVTFFLLCLM